MSGRIYGRWTSDSGSGGEVLSTQGGASIPWFHDQNGIWGGFPGEGVVRLTSTRKNLPELPDDVEAFAIGDREGRFAWSISSDRLFEMVGLRWVDRTSELPRGTANEFASVAVLPDGRASLVTRTGSILLYDRGVWANPATFPAGTAERVVAGSDGDFWFLGKRRLSRYEGGAWSTVELEAEPLDRPMLVANDRELYWVVGPSELLRVAWETTP